MLDKQEFYHGAAIIQIFEDPRYERLRKHEYGYLINDSVLVFLKYSTKSRSPWRFSFTQAEVMRLSSIMSSGWKVVVALVCGGDGVCALQWGTVEQVLGKDAGWVSVRRKFNESYGVSGPHGELQKKVQLQQWPAIVFDSPAERGKPEDPALGIQGGVV